MNIKRIIKEELSKILEGDVIRPKFGGHDDDEDGDDVEPIPAPRKTIIKKKVVVPAKKA